MAQRCDSLGLDEDICVCGVQHKFADELLRDGNGSLVGHAEIRKIIQESARVKQAGTRRVSNVIVQSSA